MKKLIIATMILLSIILAFSACGGKTNTETTHTHINETADHACDICGKYLKGEHVFSDEYTYLEDFHYRATICCESNFATDKGDHVFEDRILKEPTCTESGLGEKFCKVCQYTKSYTIASKGHRSDGILRHDENSHWLEYLCGCEIEKVPHLWDEGKITTEPTCTSEGVKTYTCKCDEFITEAVPTVPHERSNKLTSDEQYHWYPYLCGCEDLIEKEEHDLTEKRVYENPTCTSEGSYYQRCYDCYQSVYTPIEKIDHTYSEEFTADREAHWHKASCGCDLVADKEAHEYDIKNVCIHCSYELIANDGFIYVLSSDYTEYYLSGVENQEMIDAIIPAESLGKPVTKILAGAFKDSSIKTVAIPSTINEIATDAFSGCVLDDITVDTENDRYSSLGGVLVDKSIKVLLLGANKKDTTIPADVEIINDSAFFGCDKIEKLVIPKATVKTGKNAFYGVLAPVSWEEGTEISEISPYTFCGYLGSELKLPSTVTTIKENAFLNSTAKVEIISGVTTIESYAFRGCTGITELYLPSTLTYVGKGAFNGCSSISEINVPFVGQGSSASGEYSLLGYIFGDDQYEGGTLIKQFYTASSSINACVPEKLKKITVRGVILQSGALQNMSMVEEIVVESGVSMIYEGALRGCTSLEKITIPFVGESVNPTDETPGSVFGYIFGLDSSGTYQYCEGSTGGKRFGIPSSIKEVTVTGGTLLQGAFSNCEQIEKITLPQTGILKIPDRAFYGCTSLKSLSIPEGVTEFGYHSFQLIEALTILNIPSTLTYIDSYAFFNSNIEVVNITDVDNWCKIEFKDDKSNPLYATGAKLYLNNVEISGEIVLSGDIATIPRAAFYGCEKITSVKLPESATTVSNYAFYNCKKLKDVTFNEGLKEIGQRAFEGSGVKVASLPSTLKYIGINAFASCDNLLIVKIPASLTSLGSLSFFDCTKLAEVYNLSSIEEEDIENSRLYMYAKAIHTVSEDSSITYTEDGLGFLKTDTQLYLVDYIGTAKDVVLPKTYNSSSYEMGNGVFRNSEITSIDTNGAVSVIGDYAFASSSIQSATLTGVTEISVDAFNKCAELSTLELDTKLSSIKDGAFANCTSLKSINLDETCVLSISSSVFNGCSSLEVVTFKTYTKEIGSQAFYNCYSLTTLENIKSINKIGAGAFYGCASIKELTFGMVDSIGDQAFMYCTGIDTITFNTISSIGTSAFSGCTSLKELITVYSKPTTLGNTAFDGCASLVSIDLNRITVGDYTFRGCTSLVLTPENTLYSVGTEAFKDLPLIKDVYFYDAASITIEIGSNAFKGSGVVNLYLSKYVSKIGNGAFEDCKKLKTILYAANIASFDSDNLVFANAGIDDTGIVFTLAKKTTTIATNIFYPSTSEQEPKTPKLKRIELEDTSDTTSVTIGENAFKNCTYLELITLPYGLSGVLGTHAFYGCTAVNKIDFYSKGSFTIDYYINPWHPIEYNTNAFAFLGHNTTGVELAVKATTTTIPAGLFFAPVSEKANITSITFEEGSRLTEVGAYSFPNMGKITTVKLPSGVKTIGDSAFSGCYGVEEIYVPKSITYIGQNAFSDIKGTLYLGVSSAGSTWAAGWSNTFRGTKVWDYTE